MLQDLMLLSNINANSLISSAFYFFNTLGCLSFEYLVVYYSNLYRNDDFLFLTLGWLFWLGFVVILLPFFPFLLNKPKAREWFTMKYIWGTLVLLFFHVYGLMYIGPILMK